MCRIGSTRQFKARMSRLPGRCEAHRTNRRFETHCSSRLKARRSVSENLLLSRPAGTSVSPAGSVEVEKRLGKRCPSEPLREPQEWPFTDSGNDLDSGSELRAPAMQTRVSSASTKPAPIFSLKVRCKTRPCLRLANISTDLEHLIRRYPMPQLSHPHW